MRKNIIRFIVPSLSALMLLTSCSVKVTPPTVETRAPAAAKKTTEAPAETAAPANKASAETSPVKTTEAVSAGSSPGTAYVNAYTEKETANASPETFVLTWNVENGDVITTGITDSYGRYHSYEDNDRLIIEDEEGRKTFGFIVRSKYAVDYVKEIYADSKNDIIVRTDNLVTAHMRTPEADYYETIYKLPGCDSSLILMTDQGEAVIESAFIMLTISVESSSNAPGIDIFSGFPETQDIPEETGNAEVLTPAMPYPDSETIPETMPTYSDTDLTLYYTVDHVYTDFLVVLDGVKEPWTIDINGDTSVYSEGDLLEVIVPEGGLDYTVNKIHPLEIYRDGDLVYPDALVKK